MLNNVQLVFYIGTDQHVRAFSAAPGTSWTPQDLTAATGMPAAAVGSPLTSFEDILNNVQLVFYIGTDQHVRAFSGVPGTAWVPQDLTAATGVVAAASGSSLSSFEDVLNNTQLVFYTGTDQHVHYFAGVPGQPWDQADLTTATGTIAAATGSPLSSFEDILNNAQLAFYIGTDQHVHDYAGVPGHAWGTQDLTAATGAVPSATGSKALSSFEDTVYNVQLVFYIGTDQHVHAFSAVPGHSWNHQDLHAATGAVTAASGSALTTGSPLNSWSTQGILLNITGQVLAGSTGVPGATVSVNGTSAAGTSFSHATITNANGSYSLFVPFGGSYTITPSLAGYTFTPASQTFSNVGGNQIQNFSTTTEAATITAPLQPQPPPSNAPAPIPPPTMSASAVNCNDVSGTWTDQFSDTFTLSQAGNSVSGSTTNKNASCGNVTWTITGQVTGIGSVSLTESNPTPAIDSCGKTVESGQTATVQIMSCSAAQQTYTGTASGGSGFAGGGSGPSGGTTTWTRTSNPPGMAVTVDLNAGKIYVTLSGQNKAALLTNQISTSSNQSTLLGSHSGASAGSSFADSLRRTSLPVGQYGSVTSTWDDITVTVPVSFYVLGNTRFSQYNIPNESQCSANPQQAWIIYAIDTACHYKSAMLGAQFIAQTNTNGTGISVSNQVLKGLNGLGSDYPCPSAPGGNTDGTNTFAAVDSGGVPITTITGAGTFTDSSAKKHHYVLSDATGFPNQFTNNNPRPGSLARDPKSTTLQFGDQILMVDSNDSPSPDIRVIEDLCPVCNRGFGAPDWPGTVAHIDSFNSSGTCSAVGVGDYGFRTAIRLR